MTEHDIHSFMASMQRDIAEEYDRIQKRATEDPGTAGDQGEENWATLLRSWLPSYFKVVTKGRILTESGYASPQIDVLVLAPSYPEAMVDKKLYLSGGVVAAFECKTTLKAAHISEAIATSAMLRRNLPAREGSPFRELNSTIRYGLLAHTHSWTGKNSSPVDNITRKLTSADVATVEHPRECLDYICCANLATWSIFKKTYMSPKAPFFDDRIAKLYGNNGSAVTAYMCHSVGGEMQNDYFSPIGCLLSHLFSHLAWTFPDMRTLELYFRRVNLMGAGSAKSRLWGIGIYSDLIKDRVCKGMLRNRNTYDEWSQYF